MVSSDTATAVVARLAHDRFDIRTRTHGRTALVALRGELDLVTVSEVVEVLNRLDPQAEGVRHLILDLRELTFIDLSGLRELLRRDEYARSNRHNLAVVRGTAAVQRLMQLTGVESRLVLVDDPDDLAPPISSSRSAPDGW